jgi:DNA-binding HxlR family transcriptional regulator
MTGRGYPHQDGGLARALEIVGERWTLLIIREAMCGVSRFDDFHASLGLSRKSLSSRLCLLVDRGVMIKAAYQLRPVRYDYRLTAKGAALAPAIAALTEWGTAHGSAQARTRPTGAAGGRC